MGDFDPDDKKSWYFGTITREESNAILQMERDSGVFLVRDSRSIHGDYALCVREENKISNYIINKIQTNGQIKFRIGDQEFTSLSSILQFYKIHYLESTSLIRPAKRLKFIARHALIGKDPGDDLSFEAGEVLTLIRKEEENWWMMQNETGSSGLVPVNYLNKTPVTSPSPTNSPSHLPKHPTPPPPIIPSHQFQTPRQLPAKARVIRRKVPCPYDSMALTLEVGDIVTVTAMHPTGQWDGEVNGKHGTFPFTYVRFEDELDEEQ